MYTLAICIFPKSVCITQINVDKMELNNGKLTTTKKAVSVLSPERERDTESVKCFHVLCNGKCSFYYVYKAAFKVLGYVWKIILLLLFLQYAQ